MFLLEYIVTDNIIVITAIIEIRYALQGTIKYVNSIVFEIITLNSSTEITLSGKAIKIVFILNKILS